MAFIPPLIAAAGPMLASAGTAISGATAGIGGIAGAASIGSTILGTAGTLASAQAEQNAARYNAQVNEIQARQAGDNAAMKSSEIIRRTRQATAAARAGALQNGFALTGSIDDLIQQAGRSGQMDALTALYDGSLQSASARASAGLNRSKAKSAGIAGWIGAGSRLLGGATDFYRMRGAELSV
jgi:hypothetical protein